MAVRRGYKVYVDVGAEFSDEGELIPKYLVWEDGTRYEIDRIVSHERCASKNAVIRLLNKNAATGKVWYNFVIIQKAEVQNCEHNRGMPLSKRSSV